MELRQLTYFEAVARHGGFTRAAQALRVAQPSVSARVAALERELGVSLFERTTRRVSLTEAGRLLLARARRIHEEIDGARADLDQLAEVLRGRVRVGAIQALHPYDLAGALAASHRRYPGIELALRAAPMHQLLDALDRDELDLVLGPPPGDPAARHVAEHLFTEELVLAVPPGHDLAARGAVALRELAREPFVCAPEGSVLRAVLRDEATLAGFVARVPFETTNLTRMRELVAHGLGVALLARSVAEEPGPAINVHPVAPVPLRRRVALVRPATRPLSPAAHACHAVLARWPAGRG